MNYKFNKDCFEVVRKALDSNVAEFLYQYLIMKCQVSKTLFKTGYIAPHETAHGIWNDHQSDNTFSIYGDIAMEVLLTNIKKQVEKISKIKLYETYSYSRLYKKGDILKKHKDRFSCEISTTLNLGGYLWSFFIETKNKNKVKINLKPGDMLIYKGNLLFHWRDKLKGKQCGQVFLHYNNIKTKGAKQNKYDGRFHLGLPDFYKDRAKHE
jgi:hypothetical protein